jgi:hypothetical protein
MRRPSPKRNITSRFLSCRSTSATASLLPRSPQSSPVPRADNGSTSIGIAGIRHGLGASGALGILRGHQNGRGRKTRAPQRQSGCRWTAVTVGRLPLMNNHLF